MRMELSPMANEAYLIRAQLQGRRIDSEFGSNQRHGSFRCYVSVPHIRLCWCYFSGKTACSRPLRSSRSDFFFSDYLCWLCRSMDLNSIYGSRDDRLARWILIYSRLSPMLDADAAINLGTPAGCDRLIGLAAGAGFPEARALCCRL